MPPMFFEGIRIDEEVIQVYDEELVEEITEGIIHVVLKSTHGIIQPKGHDCVLKQPISTTEHYLPFFFHCDMQAVVSIPNIEFREIFGTQNTVKKFADKR